MSQCAVYSNTGPARYNFNFGTAVAVFNQPEYFVDASMQDTFNKFTSCSAANDVFTQLLNRIQGASEAAGFSGLGLHISKPQISSADYGSPRSDFFTNNLMQLAERNVARLKTWSNPGFMQAILERADLAPYKVDIALETAVTFNPLNSEQNTENRLLQELATQLVVLNEIGDVSIQISTLANSAQKFMEGFFIEEIDPVFGIPYKKFVGIDIKSEPFINTFNEAFSQFALPLVDLYEKTTLIPQTVSSLFEDCRQEWGLDSPIAQKETKRHSKDELEIIRTKIEAALRKSQQDLNDVDTQDLSNLGQLVRIVFTNLFKELDGEEEISKANQAKVELAVCLAGLSLLENPSLAGAQYMSCMNDFHTKMQEIHKHEFEESAKHFRQQKDEGFEDFVKMFSDAVQKQTETILDIFNSQNNTASAAE